MKHIALGIGCVLLLACGGEPVEEELPVGSGEQDLTALSVDLPPYSAVRSMAIEAALRENAEISRKADSAALDLERYSLHQDEICGGQQCPVADAPCKVHWYSVWHRAPVPVCACEHRGYQFPCR